MAPHQPRYLGPTQKDIARALGVAQSTVATALNPARRHKLSAEIVEHIQRQADKMGYRPQRFAQIMQGGRSRAVGIVTAGAGHGPSDAAIHRMAHALHQKGFHVIRVDSETFGGDPDALRNHLLDHLVECLVLCNVGLHLQGAFVEEFDRKKVPVIGFRTAFDDGMLAVRHDVRQTFYDLTRLHLALGSRSLALSLTYRNPALVDRPPVWTNTERALGFYTAIQDVGGEIIVDPAARDALLLPVERRKNARAGRGRIVGKIFHPVETELIYDMQELGYFRVQEFCSRGELPKSLLCSNDDMALGALAACGDFGIRVPSDLRISGCDDKALARFASVPLTTAKQPNDEMADYVTAVVIRVMEGNPEPLERKLHRFPCEIIVSNSVGTGAELDEVVRSPELQGVRLRRSEDRRTRFLPLLKGGASLRG